MLAEGLAKHIFGKNAWIESAGSEPKSINPCAVEVMNEIGIDISKQFSKNCDQISPKFIVGLDYIVTLCAEEVCPTMVAQKAKRIHWSFTDPSIPKPTREEQLEAFRVARDGIRAKIENLANELKFS